MPPWYENELQMQSMHSTQDMLETAPIIVSDSTLLRWSVSCKLMTLGMEKTFVIGGYGTNLLSLPENMKKDILAGAPYAALAPRSASAAAPPFQALPVSRRQSHLPRPDRS